MKNTVLSYRKECTLSTEDRQAYLAGIRSDLKSRKLTNITKGAVKIGPKLYNATQKIAVKAIEFFTEKDCEVVVEGVENIPEEAALFALNHQGILDTFITIPFSQRHAVILHGYEVNKLLIAAQVNTGLIKVIKGNKDFNQGARLDAISLLMNDTSIVWFPESTWNLSPNKILLPLNYGFVDVARIAKRPIVPVAVENTYTLNDDKCVISKVHVRYGKCIRANDFDDISEVLELYKEQMSTMLYEMVEAKGVFNRFSMDVDKEYAKFLEMSFKNLKLGKLNWPKEKKYIFKGDDEFYQFFNINEYEYDESYCEKDLDCSVKYYRRMN